MKRVTVAAINKAFEDRGVKERLKKGRDHFFFHGGDTPEWSSTCVFVDKVSAFDIQGWHREHARLRGLRRPHLFPDYEKYLSETLK